MSELFAESGREVGREDRVAVEEPLEIRMAWPGAAPTRAWVTMRTPGHDFELAAGWAWHEGLLGPGMLSEVAYCTEAALKPEQVFNVVTITFNSEPLRHLDPRHQTTGTGSSACGVCGKDSVSAALSTTTRGRWEGPTPGAEVVRQLPDLVRPDQRVFERTGGVHAAALCSAQGEVLVVREDIGRHNAVDKVTGARLLSGHDPAEACLFVSGRAGFELVQKAVAAGVGALAAVGAPSSLAVALAKQSDLALYGFTSSRRCVKYA